MGEVGRFYQIKQSSRYSFIIDQKFRYLYGSDLYQALEY